MADNGLAKTKVFDRLALGISAKDYYWAEKVGWLTYYVRGAMRNVFSETRLWPELEYRGNYSIR